MLVVGVVGAKGSGKGTFSKLLTPHLRGKKVEVVRTSDVLNDTLKMWGIESTRSNLQNLAIIMDKQYGKGSLSRAVESKIRNFEADVVVLEGIRWRSDVEMLRSFEGNVLVYITADARVRWERTRERGEKSDERRATWEQFKREERAGTEVDIVSIGAGADVTLENNGSLEEFEGGVSQFFHNELETSV